MRRKKQEKEPKAPPKEVSIRWKLAFYLSMFAAALLIVTWVFQILLLSSFYRLVKKEELKSSATELAAFVGQQESIEKYAYKAALDHSLGVSVYRVEDGKITSVLAVDATGNDVPSLFSPERLSKYYDDAIEEDGYFCMRIGFGGYPAENPSLWEDLPIHDDQTKPQGVSQATRLIAVQLASDATGEEQYMILLTSSMQPLGGTVKTLKAQYSWILAAVVFATLIMVVVLYQKISRPLINMTNSAKELGAGNYHTHFSGEGYRETRELASTLNYASMELSRVDQLRKELIANISHDLRTPLTMIKGYAEVMRDIPDENTPENLQAIVDETEHLSALVNDLLDLSRIQSGNRKPEKSVFDLTESVREVMGRYETFTRHQGYRISFSSEQNVAVYADRFMILQVIYNLINNAINYTGDDKTVSVIQTVRDGRVRITVKDTGKGIPPEEQPHIWESYYRGEKKHRRAVIGTGLGLSIVKQTLDLHGAAYGLDSVIGKGSDFWFELPVVTNLDLQNEIKDKETHL